MGSNSVQHFTTKIIIHREENRLNKFKKWQRQIKRKPLQFTRSVVQIVFAFFLLYVGLKFYGFYLHFASMGVMPYVERPPAVEGFLPISAFVALKVWLTTWEFDHIHPAGLILFTFFVASGFVFRKAFCGWMCPVGTLSEWTGKLGNKVLKKQFEPPKWLVWVLTPLKYLLLLFFAKMVIFNMPVYAAKEFLQSPYNKISDVKMLLFFLQIGSFALTVIFILFILSLFIKNFWCRFLCPYGALIGIGGLFGISRITRNEDTCINCNQCTRACPQGIRVSEKKQVLAPECTACFACVEACPVKDTLKMKTTGFSLNKWVLPATFFSLFFITIVIAKVTGHWETTITYEEFQQLITYIDYLTH